MRNNTTKRIAGLALAALLSLGSAQRAEALRPVPDIDKAFGTPRSMSQIAFPCEEDEVLAYTDRSATKAFCVHIDQL